MRGARDLTRLKGLCNSATPTSLALYADLAFGEDHRELFSKFVFIPTVEVNFRSEVSYLQTHLSAYPYRHRRLLSCSQLVFYVYTAISELQSAGFWCRELWIVPCIAPG